MVRPDRQGKGIVLESIKASNEQKLPQGSMLGTSFKYAFKGWSRKEKGAKGKV